jgi:transcriptional regulator with XRE-family HTH domain
MKKLSDKEYLLQIGIRVRKLRGALTQKELGRKLGADQHVTIGRIERGEVNCGILFLRKLSEELGVTIQELLP